MSDDFVPPVTVTTTDANGKVLGKETCEPDSYVLIVGPDVTVSQQVWATGTQQLTIKKTKYVERQCSECGVKFELRADLDRGSNAHLCDEHYREDKLG